MNGGLNGEKCLRTWKVKLKKTPVDITHFMPMYPFIFMLSGAHQWLCSKYFAAVFMGVFRTLTEGVEAN